MGIEQAFSLQANHWRRWFTHRPAGGLALFAVYCLAFLLLRLWASPNMGTDDVEQAMLAQGWAWGYNPAQPPLYTWLLLGLYKIFGVGGLAHLVLKYSLLFAVYSGLHLLAFRWISPENRLLGSASLLLLYPFAWGVHAGYTHSLLMAALVPWVIWAFDRAFSERRWVDTILLGVLLGIALQSKFNFVILAAALVASIAFEERYRGFLVSEKMAVAVGIAGLLLMPQIIWLLGGQHEPGRLMAKITMAPTGNPLVRMALSTGKFAQSALLALIPFWVIALSLLWPALRRPTRPSSPWPAIVARAVLISMLIVLLVVVAAGVSIAKERYLLPLIMMLPLVTVAAIDRIALSPWRRFTYIGAVPLAAVLGFGFLLVQGLFEAEHSRRTSRLAAPIPELAARIKAAGFSGGNILAADEHLGANLRFAFPDAFVMIPDYAAYIPVRPRLEGKCLIVWAGKGIDGAPAPLQDLARRLGLRSEGLTPVQKLDLPLMRYPKRTESYGFVITDCKP
ncbi:ArnT family glycosyltransferase [Lacibacterium aquatile]|uniref:ArnT family glycosyltransferase n=1 Tax=Lacibacterium aquatile TaxID=1168082 RepID=A0ABW5DWV8_9PROT